MRIAFAADHAGFSLKERLMALAIELGHEARDLGTRGLASVDYPDYGAACGRAVVAGEADLGVAVCGTGIGISIAANKVAGARAALVTDSFTAQAAREHNDANLIAFGERVTGPGVAELALRTFREARFAGGRHQGRVDKIRGLEAVPKKP